MDDDAIMKKSRGLFLLLFAALCYSSAGVFDRSLSVSVDPVVQVFIRTVLSVIIFSLAFFATRSRWIKIQKTDKKFFLSQGLFSFFGFLCFILAVIRIPIGFALLVFYCSVLLSGFVYGKLAFKERLDKTKIIALISSVSGLCIMYFGRVEEYNIFGILFALIAGASFSLNFAISKNVSDKYPPLQINLSVFLISSVISVLFLPFAKEIDLNFDLHVWILFVAYVLVIAAAYITSLLGYKYMEAQKASIVLLMEIVFGVMMGFIFFSEIPALNTVVGGLLIISALIISNLKKS